MGIPMTRRSRCFGGIFTAVKLTARHIFSRGFCSAPTAAKKCAKKVNKQNDKNRINKLELEIGRLYVIP